MRQMCCGIGQCGMAKHVQYQADEACMAHRWHNSCVYFGKLVVSHASLIQVGVETFIFSSGQMIVLKVRL